MKSDIESTLNTLVSSAPGVSCAEAAQQIFTICDDYLKTCAEQPAQSSADADEDEDEDDPYRGNSTPGVPKFFTNLWEGVIERVQNAPVEEQAYHDHTTRLVDLVRNIKENPQPGGNEWSIQDEKCGWKDLPLLGQTIRDVYNEPIDTMAFDSSLLTSPEGQTVVAGVSQPGLQAQGNETNVARLANARHQWLSLQSFISRLWRDCDCPNYALYAIWALRSALEDWPKSPPSCDAECETFEESPAFLAFQVEAAAIWICNTAPLMYKCTEIWGPKGNPQWPKKSGAPGRGGQRWSGVDGYDRGHKRWQLWKDVLGEVIEWCDGQGQGEMGGWKVKDAATRALEAMKDAERQ